jgi:hypothetical protein
MSTDTKTVTSEQSALSYYIQTSNKYGIAINIPVIDVRDGVAERTLANQFIKASNRSKFINYNEYHVSRKRQ